MSVPTPPAAPSGLTATAARQGNNARITLSWTDNSNNETGLTPSTVAANTTNFQTGNVSRNTVYWFRVRAFNASGSSAWSNVVSILTPP